jgi:hypothetical protein
MKQKMNLTNTFGNFFVSWKLAIGLINDIYETLTRFLSMKLCKSDIIHWYILLSWIMLPGQKFISTLGF